MRVTVSSKALHRGLQIVNLAKSRSSYLPITSNVLLEAADGALTLTRTNLEATMVVSIVGGVDEAGSITAPATPLEKVVQGSTAAISLVATDSPVGLSVSQGSSETVVLKGESAEEFPPTPRIIDKDATLEIPVARLFEGISQVSHTMARGDLRPVLHTLLLERGSTLVGVDGYRIGIRELDIDPPSGWPEQILVPFATVGLLARLLRSHAAPLGVVHINAGPTHLCLDVTPKPPEITSIALTSQRATSSFPNYSQIIPTDFKSTMTVDRLGLLQVVTKAASFNDVIRLQANMAQLNVSSRDAGVGAEFTTTIPAVASAPARIALPGVQLTELLKAFRGDQVRMCWNSPNQPVLWQDPADQSYQEMVMPMFVQRNAEEEHAST